MRNKGGEKSNIAEHKNMDMIEMIKQEKCWVESYILIDEWFLINY